MLHMVDPASRILAACKAIAESEELNKNAQSEMSILGVKEFTKQCKSEKVAKLRKVAGYIWLVVGRYLEHS